MQDYLRHLLSSSEIVTTDGATVGQRHLLTNRVTNAEKVYRIVNRWRKPHLLFALEFSTAKNLLKANLKRKLIEEVLRLLQKLEEKSENYFPLYKGTVL